MKFINITTLLLSILALVLAAVKENENHYMIQWGNLEFNGSDQNYAKTPMCIAFKGENAQDDKQVTIKKCVMNSGVVLQSREWITQMTFTKENMIRTVDRDLQKHGDDGVDTNDDEYSNLKRKCMKGFLDSGEIKLDKCGLSNGLKGKSATQWTRWVDETLSDKACVVHLSPKNHLDLCVVPVKRNGKILHDDEYDVALEACNNDAYGWKFMLQED